MTPTETQMSTIERHNLLRCLIARGIYSLCLVHHGPCKNKNDRKRKRLDLAASCRSADPPLKEKRPPTHDDCRAQNMSRNYRCDVPPKKFQLTSLNCCERSKRGWLFVHLCVCVWVNEGVGISVLNFEKKKLNSLTTVLQGNHWQMCFLGEGGSMAASQRALPPQ